MILTFRPKICSASYLLLSRWCLH